MQDNVRNPNKNGDITTPSKAAKTLAEKIRHDISLSPLRKSDEETTAEVIQSALAELLEKAESVNGWIGDDCIDCHKAHDALNSALEPWRTK